METSRFNINLFSGHDIHRQTARLRPIRVIWCRFDSSNSYSDFQGLGFIKKHYDVTVDWHSSAKILFSSATAAALTYAVVAQLGFASWIRLVIGVVFFIVIFTATALLTRTIDKSDINNLRGMTSNLGFVGKLLNTLLSLLERIMNALKLQ